MHEVAATATALIEHVLVGISRTELCLRLTGEIVRSTGRGLSIAVVVAESDVRVVGAETGSAAADRTLEVVIPFDHLGVPPGGEFQFAIQVRDGLTILETVPAGRYWTLARSVAQVIR